MKSVWFWPIALSAILLLLAAHPVAAKVGQVYEAALPEQLATEPDLCAWVACKAVMPAADSFSPRQGRPPYAEAYAGSGAARALVGYVFLSTDIVDVPGYSGQPIVTLIGMDTRGVITGTQVLRHSEPILLLGIPESGLMAFIHQYVGKFVGDKIEIGASQAEPGVVGLDAISGATVTVIAENQTITRAAMMVAKQVGIIAPLLRPQVAFHDDVGATDWAALLKDGSIRRLTVHTRDVGQPYDARPYIDLYFGYLNVPGIGRAILGEAGYRRLMEDLKPGEHAIFVVANGIESFKGSGFVRGGIFDRIHVVQDMDSFTFRDLDYLNLYGVKAAGAPGFRESATFIIRSPSFAPAYPWNLVFLANRIDTNTGTRTFVSFEREYWLPAKYLVGGRPADARSPPLWQKIWRGRALETIVFLLILAAAGTLYAGRDWFVRRANRKHKRWVEWPKFALWLLSIGFIGFYLKAVPSITQVLTWFHSILFKWEWELFLSDPFLFLFWIFVIITTFFWGRGMFCGWLCPYGALTEIAHRIAARIGLKRFQRKLPQRLHDRLKWVKYVVFAGLLVVSFYSIGMAEKLAEVEPFKTTFLVSVWSRSWPFVTFWVVLLVLSLFIERPFCKYLCPLGASLAIPSTFRWWGLKRKQECTTCHACAAGCDSQSIDARGNIDPRECMLCLDCMILYYDDHSCPPLVKERKQRTRAGQPLTRIGADGYFTPLPTVPAAAPARATTRPTWRPLRPKIGSIAWLRRELVDHFIPWNRSFLQWPILLRAAGIGLTVLVTWVWLLGAVGRLGPGIILGWWLAWSVYEMVTRMHCKPWVKEGPWWGHHLRPASWADMASYVAVKNLLIGAALFLLMRGTGVLDFLQNQPQLRWLY